MKLAEEPKEKKKLPEREGEEEEEEKATKKKMPAEKTLVKSEEGSGPSVILARKEEL